jgi:hypothetical protein
VESASADVTAKVTRVEAYETCAGVIHTIGDILIPSSVLSASREFANTEAALHKPVKPFTTMSAEEYEFRWLQMTWGL